MARARTVALAGSRAKAPGSAGGAAGGGGAAAAFGAVGAGRGGGMGARGGPGGGGFGGRPGGVDDMVGRLVRITKGPHKGLIGTIKSANPSQYRVELNARGKTLPFPRDFVREEHSNRHSIDTGASAGAAGGAGAGAAGLYGPPGAATPAWIGGGGMTPAVGFGGGMGAATPAYGLGGQTPWQGAFGVGLADGFLVLSHSYVLFGLRDCCLHTFASFAAPSPGACTLQLFAPHFFHLFASFLTVVSVRQHNDMQAQAA